MGLVAAVAVRDADPPRAIDYYERALKIRPNNPGIIVDLGAMYRQNGEPEKAIAMFQKAIELDPQLPQAHFNLGMVLRMEKDDPQGAAKAWKRYLELDPNSQAREFLESEIEKAGGE
jgi:Flp pilus assembly protein TadD